MDHAVIDRKLDSLQRCVQRIESRCPTELADLVADIDAQDVVVLNLSRAVQLCVDIAVHDLASLGQPAPETMGQAFDALVALGRLPADLGKCLRAAVGFRNLAVHNYDAIRWEIVHAIAHQHRDDFRQFAACIKGSK